MDVLIVGSGGREHALAWKLRSSPDVRTIYIAPGNAGTARIGENVPLERTADIVAWARKQGIGMVVVGPDNYLAEGMIDALGAAGIPAFGPTKAAARIEWSKKFAKEIMREANIPTADSRAFSNYDAAISYIEEKAFPLVIKADGLAFGKGVVVAQNTTEARQALTRMFKEKHFGDAATEVLIEEFLEGEEISVHAFCDGKQAVLFPPARDHKRIFEANKGPNTGGMGTIVPVLGITKEIMEEIERRIVVPLLRTLEKRGTPFKGILFPGIMLTKNGPYAIEFNARFGDPETQSYARLLESDLLNILRACTNGSLNDAMVRWSEGCAACVVAASKGYPEEATDGCVIKGIDEAERIRGVEVFHAGTRNTGGSIVTAGGRVLGVTAIGQTLDDAIALAYKGMEKISFDGMQFRKDIGRS